jgi:hypothetical protein
MFAAEYLWDQVVDVYAWTLLGKHQNTRVSKDCRLGIDVTSDEIDTGI